MKYYYLLADGSTAGPVTLETLVALMAEGKVTVATMVVPMGGEDWTPLARVLKFFYTDEAGATPGPVAFSELNRLYQVGALSGDAWVLEEGGTQWKLLSAVLAGGGVEVVVPARTTQLPRTPTGAYLPGPGSHAAPATSHGRVAVRRRATGGMRRPPFFIFLGFLVFFFVGGVLLTARLSKMPFDSPTEINQIMEIFHRHTALVVGSLVTLAAALVVIGLRVRNIGWSALWQLFFLLPAVLGVLTGYSKDPPSWMVSLWVVSALAAMAVFVPVAGLPPGYSRHRRMDPAAWVIMLGILIVYAGVTAWGFSNRSQFEKEMEKRKNPQKEKADPAGDTPAAAHIQGTRVLTLA